MITDGYFERTFYPFVAQAEPAAAAAGISPIDRLPLVETIAPSEGGGSVAEVHFEPTRDPFLIDHQFRGKPLLPAVIGFGSNGRSGPADSPARRWPRFATSSWSKGCSSTPSGRWSPGCGAAAEHDGTIACDLVSDFRNRADKIHEERPSARAGHRRSGRRSRRARHSDARDRQPRGTRSSSR